MRRVAGQGDIAPSADHSTAPYRVKWIMPLAHTTIYIQAKTNEQKLLNGNTHSSVPTTVEFSLPRTALVTIC